MSISNDVDVMQGHERMRYTVLLPVVSCKHSKMMLMVVVVKIKSAQKSPFLGSRHHHS